VPFNAASDAFQLHPDFALYGPSTLRTCQAALALALGNFQTTLREDAVELAKLRGERDQSAGAAPGQLGQLGSGERNDAICAIEFRMGKKEVIKRGMEAIDARLRAVLAAPAAPGDFSVVPPK